MLVRTWYEGDSLGAFLRGCPNIHAHVGNTNGAEERGRLPVRLGVLRYLENWGLLGFLVEEGSMLARTKPMLRWAPASS